MRKHGVFKVDDEKVCYDDGCNLLTLKSVDKTNGDVCRSRLVCGEIKKAKRKDVQLGPVDVFSPTPPSQCFKIMVSLMMTGPDHGHRDGNVRCVRSAPARWSPQVETTHTFLKGTNRREN